jgi:ATP-dependent Clp protease adaptor protein ClpS
MSAYVSPLTFIRPDAPQLHSSAAMAAAKAATKGAPPPATPEPNFADGGELVVERQEKKTVPPPLYQVVLLNDDYTPMEFVVAVIERFFNKDHETAVQIMLMVHMKGKGVCGVFSRDIAASKVEQVQAAARKAGHPLQCLMEAA